MNTYTGKGEKNMENFRNNLFKVTILLLLINQNLNKTRKPYERPFRGPCMGLIKKQ